MANISILAKHEIFHIWFLMGLSSTLRKTFYESLKLAELLKDVFLSNLPFTEQRYFSHQSKVILLKIYLFFFFCLSFFYVSFCINFDPCIIDLQCDVHIVQRINNSLSETTKSIFFVVMLFRLKQVHQSPGIFYVVRLICDSLEGGHRVINFKKKILSKDLNLKT